LTEVEDKGGLLPRLGTGAKEGNYGQTQKGEEKPHGTLSLE
jgi:hypothetical protein